MYATVRITVIVSEAEYAKIKQAAGLIPLSAYLKAAVLAQLPPDGRGHYDQRIHRKRRDVLECRPMKMKQ